MSPAADDEKEEGDKERDGEDDRKGSLLPGRRLRGRMDSFGIKKGISRGRRGGSRKRGGRERRLDRR